MVDIFHHHCPESVPIAEEEYTLVGTCSVSDHFTEDDRCDILSCSAFVVVAFFSCIFSFDNVQKLIGLRSQLQAADAEKDGEEGQNLSDQYDVDMEDVGHALSSPACCVLIVQCHAPVL